VALVELPRRKARALQGRIAVIGRPNTGKTTLFNALAGTRHHVGNYPGVTVEGVSADVTLGDQALTLEDLPGTYSLCGRTDEERIAIRALLGLDGRSAPDAVLLVLDATQLEQQLYLAAQVAELDRPTVVALSFADEARRSGVDIDVAALGGWLGVPTVAVSGTTGEGLDDLRSKLATVMTREPTARDLLLPAALNDAVARVADGLPEGWRDAAGDREALALWALQSVEDDEPELGALVGAQRRELEAAGVDVDAVIAQTRWDCIDEALPGIVRQAGRVQQMTDRVDRVLVHPVYGFALFLLIMTIVFQGLFAWSNPAIEAIEALFGWFGGVAEAALPAGLFQEFVVAGLIGGVGSVLVFLPQIVLLFLLIGVLEDSGYMARIAYLMDRVMKACGLHGRAFVPMLSGFACAVPAILATRTLENRRDRILTMMVVPLMTCAARLPVYTLIIAALFPVTVFGGVPVQGLLMAAMYLLGILSALVVAAVLGRTLLQGKRAPLLMELPPYRLPQAGTILRQTWGRTKVFLTDAGTVILAATIVLWFLLSFPRIDEATLAPDQDVATVQLNGSYGAQLGRAMEPVIEPLGFDWSIGVGLVGSFAAREVFVATMGVVYGAGEVDETSATLRDRIRAQAHADGRPVYSPLVGLSLMVFFALSAQCMSTLAAIKRETKSWGWPAFVFGYMTALAWVASFVVYQGGRLLGFG
jgi:ferrous iron transport protein B